MLLDYSTSSTTGNTSRSEYKLLVDELSKISAVNKSSYANPFRVIDTTKLPVDFRQWLEHFPLLTQIAILISAQVRERHLSSSF